MQLIYLLENHVEFGSSTRKALQTSLENGDRLYTSYLALGEVLVGAGLRREEYSAYLQWAGFDYLLFDGACVSLFAELRSQHNVRTPDAVHVASAARFGVDTFYTNDRHLLKLAMGGIGRFVRPEGQPAS